MNNWLPTTYRVPSPCISQCVHVDITDDLIQLALKEEQQLHIQKGDDNPTTLPLNKRSDFVGSLAQNGVKRFCYEAGVALEDFTSFYDSTIHADNYDFRHRGVTVDIQGSPIGAFPDGKPIVQVFTKSRFLTKNDKEGKFVDKYLFCKVDFPSKKLHIVGLIDYTTLWENGQTMEKTGNYSAACHYCLASQLTDFRKFLFGV